MELKWMRHFCDEVVRWVTHIPVFAHCYWSLKTPPNQSCRFKFWDPNILRVRPTTVTHLPLWCCPGSTWWRETLPLRCYRTRWCCTGSQPAARGLQSGTAALWRWSPESSSPLLPSDSPLWPWINQKTGKDQCVGQRGGGGGGTGTRLTLMWHFVIGEKPSCPGLHLNISLLDCISETLRPVTGLGGAAKHHESSC